VDHLRLWGVTVALMLWPAAPSAAQSPQQGMSGAGPPAWMTSWSPFTLSADLPRTGTTSPSVPSIMQPPPRVGLFWTGGNPGAIPFEVADEWVQFQGTSTAVNGDYRRPLDPGEHTRVELTALGWRPLHDRGAVIGRVISDQRSLRDDPGVSVRPYGSSPFDAVDTARVESRHATASLEGAGGWRLGRFGLGIGAGYEAHDHRTRRTGKPRFGRAAVPALSVGLVTGAGSGSRVGAYARWSGFAETTQSAAVAEIGLIRGIVGHREPVNRAVTSGSPFFLRTEHDARAVGLNAGGSAGGVEWTSFVEASRMRQTSSSDRTTSSPTVDVWEAESWAIGAAAQWWLARALWTVDLRWKTLSGEAILAEADEADFEADESALMGSLEARLDPEGPGWGGAVRLSVGYETRDRLDMTANLTDGVASLSPGIGVHLGRSLGRRTLVAGGLGYSAYRTRGTIPFPQAEGPAYQRDVHPEIALRASSAASWSAVLEGRHEVGPGILLSVHARRDSASPVSEARDLPFRPSGNRSSTSVGLMVALVSR